MEKIRENFPILTRLVGGKPLVYLDNAATTQKPASVIEAEKRYYSTVNANIHRGIHSLSQEATEQYEGVREKLARALGVERSSEIIFTKGCTETVNLVAQSWGRTSLNQGDVILASYLEHHSNIVPWQLVAAERGASVVPIPISDQGEIELENFKALLTPKVKLVAITEVSNAIGTITPLKEIIGAARKSGALVFVDGAQGFCHSPQDPVKLGCDFYAISAHKAYGPTGVGALWGRSTLLDQMPPYQGGGDMIASVGFQGTTYAELPAKFEAGTPNIAGVIAFGAALDFIESVGRDAIIAHEAALTSKLLSELEKVDGIRIVGTPKARAGIVSFLYKNVHPHDIGTVLDNQGVAIRTGHHCAMPLMTRLGIPGTARISFAIYNNEQEIETAVAAIRSIDKVFGGRGAK